MRDASILILGGYGGAGLPTARHLLQETDARVYIAGRHRETAEKAAQGLNRRFPGDRVRGLAADASQPDSLRTAFTDVDLVVVCSTTAKYVGTVARAALDAGIDYLDIHYAQEKVPVLRSLVAEIRDRGLCFITEAGFHPGLPAAFVRYAERHLPNLTSARIGFVVNVQRIGSTASILEMVEEFSDFKSYVLKDGRWREATFRDMERIDFGLPFGIRACYPMFLEEMRSLPERGPLKDLGLYAAGFNWFVDGLVLPMGMALGKIRKGLGVRLSSDLLAEGITTFARPPFGCAMKLDAKGGLLGESVTLELTAYHEDGYEFTAIPTVACLLQYLDGSIAKPGLWMMGHIVDPDRLVSDMVRMGVRIEVSESGRPRAKV